MIDYKTEELDPIFKEFNVLHTERVDPTFVKAMSDDTVIILWLVGFNVFQGLLIILILTLCYNQRAKYKRRLKAATIGNSIISDTLLRRKNIQLFNFRQWAVSWIFARDTKNTASFETQK